MQKDHATIESNESPPNAPRAFSALILAAIVTLVVTVVALISHYVSIVHNHLATLVALTFLAATWQRVWKHETETIRFFGLSLGGVFETEALSVSRMVRDLVPALGWAFLFSAVTFPPFWIGYKFFFHIDHAFVWKMPHDVSNEILGQLFVTALPEEAFFRGYLQTELDQAWGKRIRVWGAELGWGTLVSCFIFALGHFLTQWNVARLVVFFPAILFSWLRARTGGIGAGVLFHAACNVFSATLHRGYL